MAKAKNTQDRKQIKGLLLFYYRALYSSFNLYTYFSATKGVTFFQLFKFGLTFLIIAIFLVPIALIFVLAINYILSPLIVNFPILNYIQNILFLCILLPLFLLCRYFVNKVIASNTLIEKISQYEEVVIYDFYEKKRYWGIAYVILFILAVLFAMFNFGLIYYFEIF